jgi:outer membrane lipoprotein-sorting protein
MGTCARVPNGNNQGPRTGRAARAGFREAGGTGMNAGMRWVAAAGVVLWAGAAQAQTADEAVEKALAAMGGRAALTKLTTRVATGTITVSTQGVDIPGTVEMSYKAPNMARSLMKLDLSAFGGAEMIIDRRCDGKTAFESNSQTGIREITGNQLENMLNASFPTPFLNYKQAGAKIEVAGKEKVGDKDAVVLVYTPKSGSVSRLYFDAQTWQLIRSAAKVNIPEAGGELEQTNDPSDYRDVDGVKIPFTVLASSPVQTITLRFQKIEHNKPLDDAIFGRTAK